MKSAHFAHIAAKLLEIADSPDADPGSFPPERLAALKARVGSEGSGSRYDEMSKTFSYNRRFFVAQNGDFGLGPQEMKVGDEVCVLYGSRVPCVVRLMGGYHAFIGECYLHNEDVMWGGACNRIRDAGKGGVYILR